jgi:RNA polymerase sigma factor (sigma-70 family)
VSDLAASPTPAPPRALPLRVLGDERLAGLTAGGSDRAFAILYERHHQALYRYCRAIVRHEEDARDVLQTTMARALAALSRGVPDAPMRPWLFRIAHNEAISVLRRRRPTIELEQAPEPEGRSLEARVEERSRLTALLADLNELPDRQRGALVMRELSGLSHEEIAAALGISVAAAKQAIFDARTGLQEFAKGRAMDCSEVTRIVSERDGRMLRGRPLRAHLRSCSSCRALRDAIGGRRADLAALAPPLPATAAAGLLSRLLGAGHGGGAGGAGGLTTGVGAKAVSAPLAAKMLAGAAVAASVAAGTVQVVPPAQRPSSSDAAPAVAAASSPRASAPGARTATAGSDRIALAAAARAPSHARPAARRARHGGGAGASAAAVDGSPSRVHGAQHATRSPTPRPAAQALLARHAPASRPSPGHGAARSAPGTRRAVPASRAPSGPVRPSTPAVSAPPPRARPTAPATGEPPAARARSGGASLAATPPPATAPAPEAPTAPAGAPASSGPATADGRRGG